MKGRRSEVGCCHTVIRGKGRGSSFLPVGLQMNLSKTFRIDVNIDFTDTY